MAATTEETVEDLAKASLNGNDPEAETEDEEDGQMLIPGTAPTISMRVGGPKPSSSQIVIQGGSVGIEGEFQKEEVIDLFVTVRIEDINFPSTRDKHGTVTSTKRRHVARMIAVTRSDAPAAP